MTNYTEPLLLKREKICRKTCDDSDKAGFSEGIIAPTKKDVLSGRGKTCYHHHGNKRLRVIVETHLKSYLAADRLTKTAIIARVVTKVRKGGGRFLKLNKDGQSMFDIGNKGASEKVSHAFRDAQAAVAKQNNANKSGRGHAEKYVRTLSKQRENKVEAATFTQRSPPDAMFCQSNYDHFVIPRHFSHPMVSDDDESWFKHASSTSNHDSMTLEEICRWCGFDDDNNEGKVATSPSMPTYDLGLCIVDHQSDVASTMPWFLPEIDDYTGLSSSIDEFTLLPLNRLSECEEREVRRNSMPICDFF